MKTLAFVCWMSLLLCFSATSQSQAQSESEGQNQAQTQSASEPEGTNLPQMLEELEQRIGLAQRLSRQIDIAPKRDRDALVFRRDERTFEILADLEALVAEMTRLPQDDPARVSALNYISSEWDGIWQALLARVEALDQRIEKDAEQLSSLSGGDRIAAEARVNSLEDIRLRYFDALVTMFKQGQELGLPVAEIQASIQDQLVLNAEILAGNTEYTASALAQVQEQLAQDTANAELAASAKALSLRQGSYLARLETMSGLLEQLGYDNTPYDSVLAQHGDSLSLEVLESGVAMDLVRDGWNAVRESLLANAPDALFKLVIFLLILLLFRMLARLTKRAVRAACDRPQVDLSTLLKNVLVSISGGTVMAIGILMALSQVGISLGPMLAGLGVAGFVVGFALQDTLGNFASGSMILIYRPYDVDDYVEVAGATGFVKKMSLVSTTITTIDNQTLVVPNSKIWGDVIKNVTAQKVRRVDLEFGIGYGDDVAHAERVLQDILDNNDMVLKKPESMIALSALADSSVNFVVRPWVKTEDYWDVYFDITREVKMRFDSEGISIPFPQRDVHLYNEQA